MHAPMNRSMPTILIATALCPASALAQFDFDDPDRFEDDDYVASMACFQENDYVQAAKFRDALQQSDNGE